MQGIEEYKELGNNMRHYHNMRFAQLSLYIAISAGILSHNNAPNIYEIAYTILGLLTTLVFAILEERTSDYFWHYHKRATKLENDLHYIQYKTWKKNKIISGTNAIRLFFIGMFGFWAYNLKRNPLIWIIAIIIACILYSVKAFLDNKASRTTCDKAL